MCHAGFALACGSSIPVNDLLGGAGKVKVNHVCHVGNVQSSCCEVCADQRAGCAASKAQQGAFAFRLFHAAVIESKGTPRAAQLATEKFHSLAGFDKHDGGLIAQCAKQVQEYFRFVRFLRQKIGAERKPGQRFGFVKEVQTCNVPFTHLSQEAWNLR